MNKLFEWCTSLSEKMSEGNYAVYFNEYFHDGNILKTVFLFAISVALVVSLIYYLVICNVSFKLAKRWCWLIILCFVGIITLFLSNDYMVGKDGNNDDSSGFYYNIDKVRENLYNLAITDDERSLIDNVSGSLRDSINEDTEPLFVELSFINAIYAIVIFVIFSIFFKRFSTHGKAIPW